MSLYVKIGTRATAALLASALVVGVPVLQKLEGRSLTAYKDIAAVWTICDGETKGVKPGMKVTHEYCDRLTKERAQEFAEGVASKLTVHAPVEVLAAHTLFAYNIGLGAYKNSTTLRLTNTGDLAGGCNAMYKFVCITVQEGKGDSTGACASKRKNKKFSKGLYNRRVQEVNLCLQEL